MNPVYLLLFLPLFLYSGDVDIKRELKRDSTLTELISPKYVDSFSELFSEGVFYGRLRLNSFLYLWDTEIPDKRKNHYTIGVGGSLIYKSAYLHGFGFTVAGYTSQNPFHMDDADVKYYKVGKGVMSRYDVATKGQYGISSFAQIYAEYKDELNSLKIGRQIFESQMTKSNDIKMIPNVFQGITLHSKMLPGHLFKAAYLDKQQLRDHTEFHHIFAYNNGPGKYDKWLDNDDTAMHQGITVSKLAERGIKDRVILAEIDNGKKEDLSYLFNYTLVPELFSSMTLDASYRFMYNDFKISPAFRYMHQFDLGAGEIGGANLKTDTVAYKDPNSVEADLYGIRFDIDKGQWHFRTGISKVADKADIISPWRAFPTGGFGYSLLQYNWYANTTSYMMEYAYNFTRYGLHVLSRVAIQDFDDDKPGVQADSNVFQLDFNKRFVSLPDFYVKLRFVRVIGDTDTVAKDGSLKYDPSYTDLRLELNYLF